MEKTLIPCVSVVITTHNRAQLVVKTVQSVLAQTYPDIEIIVVDNESDDDTEKMLAVFGDKIRYVHKKNEGACCARNVGIKLAQGNFIGLLDSDDLYLPDKIEHSVAYLNEHPEFKLNHNERFEFLGDAVLEIVVTEYLFKHYPRTPEGDMTNWRAALVNATMLAMMAEEFKLYKYLYLSKGEKKDQNPKAKQYIIANAFEALIGSVYIDQGMDTAKEFIIQNIVSKLPNILKNKLYLDPKTRFQESSQEKSGVTPTYKVLKEEGPDHAKTFTVGVYLKDELIAKGKGLSKQEAQVEAALKAIKNKKWE